LTEPNTPTVFPKPANIAEGHTTTGETLVNGKRGIAPTVDVDDEEEVEVTDEILLLGELVVVNVESSQPETRPATPFILTDPDRGS